MMWYLMQCSDVATLMWYFSGIMQSVVAGQLEVGFLLWQGCLFASFGCMPVYLEGKAVSIIKLILP